MTKSLASYTASDAPFKLQFNLFESIKLYSKELTTVILRSTFTPKNSPLQILFFALTFYGIYLFAKERNNRKIILFITTIALMSAGILIFNVGLTQLYQGTASGWIILTTAALQTLWLKAKIPAIALVALLIFSLLQNFKNLNTNDNFFFAPEQKCLASF